MLVYGGRGTSGLLDNVLALSLAGTAEWNVPFISSPPPAAREWAAAIVDPVRDRLVIVGGGTPGPTSNVSALTLGATHLWGVLTPSALPAPFRAATLVHDPVRNRMLLIGGLDPANIANNNVWSVDLNTPTMWTRLTPAGTPPTAPAYTSAIYDATRDRVLVFGGSNGTAQNHELWTLSLGGTPTWTFGSITDPAFPASRGTHGAIYDPVRDRMIVADGTNFNGTVFQDTWALPLAGEFHWQLLTPNGPAPSARYLAGWGYDPGRDRLLVYGGVDLAGHRFDDAWALQFGPTDQWILLEPLASGTMTYRFELKLNDAGLEIGIFDGHAIAPDLIPVLPASAAPGSFADASFFSGPDRVVVNVYDASATLLSHTTHPGTLYTGFGFYVQGPDGTHFSQDQRNTGGAAQALFFWSNGILWGNWWICFERTPADASDRDFDDAVVFSEGVLVGVAVQQSSWARVKARFR